MSYCDCCHEEVPSDFFCDTCSNEPELVTTTQPVATWDYTGPDTEEVEEYITRSICLNCCTGHNTNKPTPMDSPNPSLGDTTT